MKKIIFATGNADKMKETVKSWQIWMQKWYL